MFGLFNCAHNFLRGGGGRELLKQGGIAQHACQARQNMEVLRNVRGHQQEKQPHRCAVRSAIVDAVRVPAKNDAGFAHTRNHVTRMRQSDAASERGAAEPLAPEEGEQQSGARSLIEKRNQVYQVAEGILLVFGLEGQLHGCR
jgi:hypothetical protein